MAIREAVVYEGEKPSEKALCEIEQASKIPINFDDIPEMSDEQLAKVAALARARRGACDFGRIAIAKSN